MSCDLAIIRAVNYSIMNLEKLREQAIKEKITIGELYVKMNKETLKRNKMLDEIIEQMIKKGYGENFMNGELVVAMIKDVLEILEKNKI